MSDNKQPKNDKPMATLTITIPTEEMNGIITEYAKSAYGITAETVLKFGKTGEDLVVEIVPVRLNANA